jgi:hypothetical protein
MRTFISRYLGCKYFHLIAAIVVLQSLLSPLVAHALPVFARQTGQNCVACHAGGQFPELTPYGRLFKLTGYTIGTRTTVPLSVMGVASSAKSSNPTEDPAFSKDGTAVFQTGSVFLAGKITDNVGLFAQATYNNYAGDDGRTGRWGADNMDVRYADRFIGPTKDLIVGLSLNNNPSLADPWNTAPAWIQYVPTNFGVTGPDAIPIISQLGQQAAGVSAYAFWNKTLYAELAGYRTADGPFKFLSAGTPASGLDPKLKSINPYVRLALSHDWGAHNAMVGLFALNADTYPDPLNPTGPTTQYRDRGIDAQYQYILDPHTVTAQASYIRETINNGDVTGIAANASNTLNQLKLKASYVYKAKYGTSLSYFRTTGTSDAILYPDVATNPGTSGWVPEVFWTPVQYVRVGAQYFSFNQFHGASSNYDGAGRNAKDNNTLFLYVWGAY